MKNIYDFESNEYTVFNIETTGLDVEKDSIIEICAVKMNNGKIVNHFSEFVKPNGSIKDEVSKITGITNGNVKDADTIEEVLPRFTNFIGGSILVSHGEEYDYSFLMHNCEKLGLQCRNQYIDSLKYVRENHPEFKQYSEKNLAKRFNIQVSNDDAYLLALILKEINKMNECEECKSIIKKYMNNTLGETDNRKGVKKLFEHCFMIDAYKDYSSFEKDLEKYNCRDDVIKYYEENEKYIKNIPYENLKGDADHHQVVLAVYRLLWGETINVQCEHTKNGKIKRLYCKHKGKEVELCGDTINTRDSAFGKNNNKLEEKNYTKEAKNAIKRFRVEYLVIPNFILTPRRLNSERGLNPGLKDQFDLYLDDIYELYKTNKNNPHISENTIKTEWYKALYNDDYFDIFNSFKDFIQKNYLQCYTIDGKCEEVKHLFKRNGSQVLPDKEQAEEYIKEVNKRINERSKEMQEALIRMLGV